MLGRATDIARPDAPVLSGTGPGCFDACMRPARAAVAAVIVALGSSGCAAPAEPTWAEELAARSRSTAGAFSPMAASVSDAMPRVVHPGARPGEETSSVSEVLVVGDFVDREPAGATAHPHDPDAFDVYSGGAVLRLRVDEVVDADPAGPRPGEHVRVLLPAVGGNGLTDQDVAARLVDLDRVVVFLAPARLTERDGYAIALDGMLLGEVDASGGVTWPVLEAVGEQYRERVAAEPGGLDLGAGWGPASVSVDVRSLTELRSLAGPRAAAPAG
jgi:hypothetical protein